MLIDCAIIQEYIPVFDSYTHKKPSKTLINSAFFEGLFALKMC
jgi:hypothetical protein